MRNYLDYQKLNYFDYLDYLDFKYGATAFEFLNSDIWCYNKDLELRIHVQMVIKTKK